MIRNSVVVVTGGGAGLGLALVDRFIAEGARVAVLDRSSERVDALRGRFPPESLVAVVGDVADWESNLEIVARATEAFGRLDTFIGNAALWDFSVSLLDLPPAALAEAFDEIFGVNVKGYVLGAKAAATALLASRGSMIFSLSNASFYAGGGGPLYTASKHAGVGLVKQLAYELAPKVRVNAVAPTGMATELRGPRSLGMDQRALKDSWDSSAFPQRVPLGFLPEPKDYVGAYLYLADRELSPTVTGTISLCDMGLGVRGMRAVAGGLDL